MADKIMILLFVLGLLSSGAGFYSMHLRKKANESWMDRAIMGLMGLSLLVYALLAWVWNMQKLEAKFLMIIAVLLIITSLFAYMENMQLRRYN